ncbi:MAG: acetylxylan esterase [Candidatus Hydrogenedentes bacterium]|nr:acetylxylan esterase [Candidatus Hydrogenedentota bacterium]
MFLVIGAKLLTAWRGRTLVQVAALIPSVLLTTIFVFGIYGLEVKYQKGQSDLRRLARLARDLPQWQSRAAVIKAGILGGARLDPLPVRTPLNACIHSRREMHGYSVENVFFESIPGFFVLGNLYTPAVPTKGARQPVVLIAQGHFANGRFNDHSQQLAATFARMGAVAFTYDMAGRGESAQVHHGNPNALTLQLWDSMRTLDFLLGRDDVDPAHIGMTGASGGGTQTFLCTAVDDRVTASAPVVMVSSWVYGGCACEIGFPIHRGAGYETNNAEIAALAAPRPQLLVSDGHDWTRTTPTKEFPFIKHIYDFFGAADNIENVHLSDEYHDYGPSKRQAVYRFFAKHLGLSLQGVALPDGTIDESPNTMEAIDAMRAFDATHPMPGNALHDWEAVTAELRTLQHPAAYRPN